ncbi:MAG: hypothetical protein AB7G37_06365 [Solirubrobacteraceae bacterium]
MSESTGATETTPSTGHCCGAAHPTGPQTCRLWRNHQGPHRGWSLAADRAAGAGTEVDDTTWADALICRECGDLVEYVARFDGLCRACQVRCECDDESEPVAEAHPVSPLCTRAA